MDFVAGRSFSKDIPSDFRRAVVVNEALVKEYGWTDAIGRKLPGNKFSDHEIVGVVKDFNYESLYTKVVPLVIVMDRSIIFNGAENVNIGSNPVPKLMIRLRPGNLVNAIAKVQQVWDRLTGEEEFVFSFVDQALTDQYRNDTNLGKIVQIATLIAVLIGSLGLYALASLAMQNRVKEISIRKVMGASENSLLVLLSRDYVVMIGISLLLSVPITSSLMNNWLQSFEYRISPGWEVFVLAGGISLIIALVTISYHTIKTALTRPAETLKYE
jgi:putative ABC transport system permease protein